MFKQQVHCLNKLLSKSAPGSWNRYEIVHFYTSLKKNTWKISMVSAVSSRINCCKILTTSIFNDLIRSYWRKQKLCYSGDVRSEVYWKIWKKRLARLFLMILKIPGLRWMGYSCNLVKFLRFSSSIQQEKLIHCGLLFRIIWLEQNLSSGLFNLTFLKPRQTKGRRAGLKSNPMRNTAASVGDRFFFFFKFPAPKYVRSAGCINFGVGMFVYPVPGLSTETRVLTRYGAVVYLIWKMIPSIKQEHFCRVSIARCKVWYWLFSKWLPLFIFISETPWNGMKVQIQANMTMFHLQVIQIYQFDGSRYLRIISSASCRLSEAIFAQPGPCNLQYGYTCPDLILHLSIQKY